MRDLPPILQQGVGFGMYINIGGGQKLNGTPCSFIFTYVNQGVGPCEPLLYTCMQCGCVHW